MNWMLVYQVLVYIENLCPELQPDTTMRDFELATLNALKPSKHYLYIYARMRLITKYDSSDYPERVTIMGISQIFCF